MKFALSFLLLVVSATFAEKCDVCKASVKGIKDGKGLAYMADLTTEQIESYIKKHVDKHCSGSFCPKLIKSLIEIADQLDDDMNSTPEELCKFIYFC
uniref:Saposin B-type domain-containing protein n=1 Tax=Caenorhabditis tropicalis TaxID=1561998 RepID=A0A1I7V2Y1_9PELO